MTVIRLPATGRTGGGLVLINSIRLDWGTENELLALGRIKHVIRTSTSHGHDDLYYSDKFDNVSCWAKQPPLIPSLRSPIGRPTQSAWAAASGTTGRVA
jgi:hypothetical protein